MIGHRGDARRLKIDHHHEMPSAVHMDDTGAGGDNGIATM
jgi:hypothetical protein